MNERRYSSDTYEAVWVYFLPITKPQLTLPNKPNCSWFQLQKSAHTQVETAMNYLHNSKKETKLKKRVNIKVSESKEHVRTRTNNESYWEWNQRTSNVHSQETNQLRQDQSLNWMTNVNTMKVPLTVSRLALYKKCTEMIMFAKWDEERWTRDNSIKSRRTSRTCYRQHDCFLNNSIQIRYLCV